VNTGGGYDGHRPTGRSGGIVPARIDAVNRRTSPTWAGASIAPEGFDGEGPRLVVATAEEELVARYGGLDPSELGLTAAMFDPPAGIFLVARSADGHVVGGVGVRPFEPEPGVGEIKRLWVDPEWRRRGVGRRLMDEAESAAHRLGFFSLHLATGDHQPEAVALYEASGWVRRRVDHTGAVLPDWHLQFSKALPGRPSEIVAGS
jgi:GNAT superfamily N-acetyltransferase